jgi:hypothetical protein
MRTRRIAVCLLALTFVATFALAGPPTATPNHVKYRDTGIANARGSAGNATIEARALLGSNGVTDLEVTTGSFDAGPTGAIERLLVKRSSGSQTLTTTHSQLSSGVVSLPLAGLARHDSFDVQAGVSGVDGNRIDVVATGGTVKLRPDVQVSDLALPPNGRAHLPVTIAATLHERNGDAGARANCVLSVNGAEADRADGIWIDAHGSVSCRFVHAFASAGTFQVTVTAANVSPGDWDTANNSVSAQIEITDALPFQRSYALASEYEANTVYRDTSPVSFSETTFTTRRQWNSFSGYADVALNGDTLTGSVVESSNGVVIDDSTDIPVTRSGYVADWGDGDSTGVTCFSGWHPVTGRSLYGCSMWMRNTTTGFYRAESMITTSREAGEVSYISRGWDATYVGDGGEYYEWNDGSSSGWGTMSPYGDTVSLTVRLTDGTTTFEATPVITLVPYQRGYGFGPSCYDHWSGSGQACSEFQFTEVGKAGEVRVP